MQRTLAVAGILLCLFGLGCAEERSFLQGDGSQRDAALKYVENLRLAFVSEYPNFSDLHKHWEDHGEEIVATLAVAESIQTPADDIAVCLVRFSIGGDVYRSHVWIRNIGGSWYPCSSQYIDEYGDEFSELSEEEDEALEEIFNRIEGWKEVTPKVWWGWWL